MAACPVPGYHPGTLLNVVPQVQPRDATQGSKKGTSPAPWWWEPAICELWAEGGKDARRGKFYDEAVEALNAVCMHGGGDSAAVGQKSSWGSAGE